MFESVDLEHKLSKEAYKELEGPLRTELLDAQFELTEAQQRSVIVLVDGLDLAGKGAVAHRLCEWLDTHYIETTAFDHPSDLSKRMPYLWRYWNCLPPKGKIGLVFGSWYHQLALDFGFGDLDQAEYRESLHEIARFEHMLAAEGVSIVKLWLQLTPSQRRERAEQAALPVATRERRVMDQVPNDSLQELEETIFNLTSTVDSPWVVIPAEDRRYRDVAAARAVLECLQKQSAANQQARTAMPAPAVALDSRSLLSELDLSATLSKPEYNERLLELQQRLADLTRQEPFNQLSVLLVFEGMDAAGKGGCIRRVTSALDPRIFRVHGFGSPDLDESLRPYLWRFWKRLPRPGHFSIFDRSHYGRVLVERVEGFCSKLDWQRAYGEINDFEQQLSDANMVVIKFWLAISEQEQLNRFKDRENKPFKRYKITEEDWRNRGRWPDYVHAADEMIDRTSTRYAPWHVIASENKQFARISVLETIVTSIEKKLEDIEKSPA